MPEPVIQAIRAVKKQGTPAKVVYLSPQGRPLTASKARELANTEHLILLCGHYEGIDQRAIDAEVDEELSIGDYVLTNGCLPALVLLDAMLRFVPGVLGHHEASNQDSFERELLDCPHYTRPEVYEGQNVPEVLQTGDHEAIRRWRLAEAVAKTQKVRPDLYQRYLWRRNKEEETKETRRRAPTLQRMTSTRPTFDEVSDSIAIFCGSKSFVKALTALSMHSVDMELLLQEGEPHTFAIQLELGVEGQKQMMS